MILGSKKLLSSKFILKKINKKKKSNNMIKKNLDTICKKINKKRIDFINGK